MAHEAAGPRIVTLIPVGFSPKRAALDARDDVQHGHGKGAGNHEDERHRHTAHGQYEKKGTA